MNSTLDAANITADECYPSEIIPNQFFLVLHILIILIGTPSNAFSLFVSCQHIKRNNELGIYLFNLALSDLCFIASLPIWMEFTRSDTWSHTRTVCIVCVFLLFTNFYTSTVLLSCIALDRYLAVVYPLSFIFLRKRRTAVVVSVAAWTLALIFNGIIISPQNMYNENDRVCLNVFPLPQAQRMMNVVRFLVGFFLPTVVVAFSYWRICMEVRANKATAFLERRRIFRLLGTVLLTLSLCFGPLHVALLLRAALEDCKPPDWLALLYEIGRALSCLNCLADPLLYCFITRTGRSSVSQAILGLKRKRESASGRWLRGTKDRT